MRRIRALLVVLLSLVAAPQAFAQLTPAPSDSSAPPPAPAASSAPVGAPVIPPVSAPAPSPADSSKPRPDPGPKVTERGSRTRRSNPASGPLFIAVLIGAMAYYVIKRFRRRM